MDFIFIILFVLAVLVILYNNEKGLYITLFFILFIPTKVKYQFLNIPIPLSTLLPLFLLIKLTFGNFSKILFTKYLKPFYILILFFPVFFFGAIINVHSQVLSYITGLVLPLIFPLTAILILNRNNINKFNKLLYLYTIIICFYGIYNYLTVTNPYLSFIDSIFAPKVTTEYLLESERNVLSTRITSTFSNPINYAGFLILVLFYYLYIYSINRSNVLLFCILIVIANILLTGTRSAIIGLILGLLANSIFNVKKNIKFIILITSIIFIIYLFSGTISKFLFDIGKSSIFFWMDKEASELGIHGSTFNSRIEKHVWVLNLLRENEALIFGNGFGYIKYFIDNYGWVKPITGFEGFFLSSLVETGIYGLIIWLLFYFKLYRFYLKHLQGIRKAFTILPLFLAYFVFVIATGVLGTLTYLILFSNLIVLYSLPKLSMVRSRIYTQMQNSDISKDIPRDINYTVH